MTRVTAGRVWYTSEPRVMFNIGFGELAIICIVLIIAVGPERLPSMMKTLGKTIRTLRQASRDIRASTGIDELLREDFDLYSPPTPPRRPAYVPPTPEPEAPAPVSRQEALAPPIDAAPAQQTPAEPAPAEPAPAAPAPAVAPVASAALLGGVAPQLPAPEPAPATPVAPAPAEPAPEPASQASSTHAEQPKHSDGG